jgi:hypothetical protein
MLKKRDRLLEKVEIPRTLQEFKTPEELFSRSSQLFPVAGGKNITLRLYKIA